MIGDARVAAELASQVGPQPALSLRGAHRTARRRGAIEVSGSPATTPTKPASRFWTTFAALALAGLGYSLLQSMVAPALPNIQRAVCTSTTNATWIFIAYLLSASVAKPIAGRLGDTLGKRRVLLIVLAALAAGTILCGLTNLVVGAIDRLVRSCRIREAEQL